MEKPHQYILCADDDQVNLALLLAFLDGLYEVKCVTDGQQCLDAVEQRKPDLILQKRMQER